MFCRWDAELASVEASACIIHGIERIILFSPLRDDFCIKTKVCFRLATHSLEAEQA